MPTDAYSKWPEVHAMSSTTAQATVQQLRKMFATHGLPQMIIFDNGPQFVSEEFKQFCSSRGIQHNTIAPYHPHSNGEAERLVETFKQSTDKVNLKTASQLQGAVIEFLAKYWSTHTLLLTAHHPNYWTTEDCKLFLTCYILTKLILLKVKNNRRLLMTVTPHHVNLLRVI